MKGNKLHRNLRIVRYFLYRETLIDAKEYFYSFLGSFVGIGLIAWIQEGRFSMSDQVYLIGSFGASSVLIYGAVQSPLAQPRNLIGGHLISAFIGVTIQLIFGRWMPLAAASAVSLSIILMQLTKTLHPPGGATALIAVLGSEQIKSLGYWYVLMPVLSGVLILFVVAVIVNNLSSNRKYPTDLRFTRVIRRRRITKV